MTPLRGRVHDILRQGRVLYRNIRHSHLLTLGHGAARRQARLQEVFRITNRFLRHLQVDYWLVYGTLLGYYRHGDVIRGDWDIDFGVLEQNAGRIWQARAQLPVGFKMYDTSHKHYGPKLYVVCDGWEADLYVHRDANGYLQSLEKSRFISEMTPVPRALVYPLQPATFLGEATSIPHAPLAYLQHLYHYIGEGGRRDMRTGYWYPPSV